MACTGVPFGHRRSGGQGRQAVVSQTQVRLHRTAKPRGDVRFFNVELPGSETQH